MSTVAVQITQTTSMVAQKKKCSVKLVEGPKKQPKHIEWAPLRPRRVRVLVDKSPEIRVRLFQDDDDAQKKDAPSAKKACQDEKKDQQ